MAAAVTLKATTLEGQLLELLQHLIDTQTKAILSAPDADRAGVRRIITASTTDLLAGIQTTTVSIPLDTEPTPAGISVIAAAVYE